MIDWPGTISRFVAIQGEQFRKIIIISMRDKDTGITTKHYHFSKLSDLQGIIINEHVKKRRTQD